MYTLNFKQGEAVDEARYATCYMSIVLAGRAPALHEWDDVIALLKGLKGVGRDTGAKIPGTQLSAFVVQDGGGVLNLQRSEWKALCDFVAAPIWMPAAIEAAQECKVWLQGIKDAAAAAPQLVTETQSA